MPRLPIALGMLLVAGCTYPPPVFVSAPYAHLMLVKLKTSPTDKAVEEFLIDVQDLLTIPQVKALWAGRPVPRESTGEENPIDDYDVGLLLILESVKDLKEFRAHPAQVEFQKKHGANIDVRVVDFSPYGGPPQPQGSPQP